MCRTARTRQGKNSSLIMGNSWFRRISSEYHLYETDNQSLERKDGQQKRRQGNGCRQRQAGNVLEPKWDNTHFAHNLIAIAKIGEGLDISRAEQLLGRKRSMHPLLIETF